MERNICDAVNDLMETHIKLWDIVDMLKSDNDEILVKATRMDNEYNRRRSNFVEEIDEIVLKMLANKKRRNEYG